VYVGPGLLSQAKRRAWFAIAQGKQSGPDAGEDASATRTKPAPPPATAPPATAPPATAPPATAPPAAPSPRATPALTSPAAETALAFPIDAAGLEPLPDALVSGGQGPARLVVEPTRSVLASSQHSAARAPPAGGAVALRSPHLAGCRSSRGVRHDGGRREQRPATRSAPLLPSSLWGFDGNVQARRRGLSVRLTEELQVGWPCANVLSRLATMRVFASDLGGSHE
jgi:hypothetical protein